MKILPVILLVLGCAIARTSMASPSLTPGKWQITVSMMMGGMPFTPPPQTFMQCLTRQQANHSLKETMQDYQRSGCIISDFSFAQGKGHWKTTCKGKHPADGEGWLTLKDAKHYKTKTRVTMHDAGRHAVMTVTGKAHWLGSACSADNSGD